MEFGLDEETTVFQFLQLSKRKLIVSFLFIDTFA